MSTQTATFETVNEEHCKYCGQFLPWQPRGRPRLFCTDAHRKRWERAEAKPKVARYCPVCGSKLDASLRDGTKYDRKECRVTANLRGW